MFEIVVSRNDLLVALYVTSGLLRNTNEDTYISKIYILFNTLFTKSVLRKYL